MTIFLNLFIRSVTKLSFSKYLGVIVKGGGVDIRSIREISNGELHADN